MSIERMKTMKEAFMCAVESQMYNLAEVDAEELGEVVDMIKDLSEAIYYCEVAKAMEDSEKYKGEEMMYYTPMYRETREHNGGQGHDMSRMYYSGSNGSSGGGYSSGRSSGSSSNSNGNSSQYSEREFPGAFQDMREGRSPRSRRMYMEAKETKQDKNIQMKELEKYVQELTSDIIEMIEGASPEEKQYLGKKISTLATRIS